MAAVLAPCFFQAERNTGRRLQPYGVRSRTTEFKAQTRRRQSQKCKYEIQSRTCESVSDASARIPTYGIRSRTTEFKAQTRRRQSQKHNQSQSQTQINFASCWEQIGMFYYKVQSALSGQALPLQVREGGTGASLGEAPLRM